MTEITGTLVLADWAEVLNGKLYAQGAAWAGVIPDRPTGMSMISLLRIPYEQAGKKHSAHMRIVTAEGDPYPPDNPARAEFQFSIGKSPDMAEGDIMNAPFAITLQGISFRHGRYRAELWLDDKLIDEVPFMAQ